MKVEVLVSTMNQQDYSLIERMHITTDAVVVNQCDKDSVEEFDFSGRRVKWINSTTRGLSISRNICIENAQGDICLIADDDLEYIEGYEDIVKKIFGENPNADIVRFQVKGIEEEFKKYPQKGSRVGVLKSLKMSSVEIAFRKERIKEIRFNELIGAGAKYCMGEENAFLIHCLKRKLNIYYYPVCISNLHIISSTWKNISDEHYFFCRGASFEAMDLGLTHLLILQFGIRKLKMFDKSLSLFKRIILMEKGREDYLRTKKDESVL